MPSTTRQREEKHLLRFLVSGGLCVTTDLSVFVLLGFGLAERALQGAAFLAATGVTTVLNYLGLRFIAFRRGIAEAEVAV